MYGVAFVVEKVELLLKPREFIRGGGADAEEDGKEPLPPPPLSRDELDTWLNARLGSITGQVMSSCKVRTRPPSLSISGLIDPSGN